MLCGLLSDRDLSPGIDEQLYWQLLFSGPDLLENDEKPGDFYSWFGNYLKTELKPKAVVIISAHWQGKGKNGIFGKISFFYLISEMLMKLSNF